MNLITHNDRTNHIYSVTHIILCEIIGYFGNKIVFCDYLKSVKDAHTRYYPDSDEMLAEMRKFLC